MIEEIDVTKLLPPGVLAQLSEGTQRRVLREVAEAARAKWLSLAGERLHRTSSDYQAAIQPVEAKGDVASVTLVGRWPNMVEHGFAFFDMRETLLGPNVPVVPYGSGQKGKHQNKSGGYYRSIFFRQGSARSTGRNFQRVTDAYAGYLGQKRARQLGRMAWDEMKKLDPSLSNPGEKTKWGGRLSTAGTELHEKGRSHKIVRGPNGERQFVRHGGAEHAAPLFEGAVKLQQTYARATQAFFGTFRTISTSSLEGWIHPGYTGARLVSEVERYVSSIAPGMFLAAVDGSVPPEER